jgi:4-alpha-glucanotransferase
MSPSANVRFLHQLAQLYGVQLSYYDMAYSRKFASTEALLAVLRSLGASIEKLSDAVPAWREKRQAEWRQFLEPVTVAWGGVPPWIRVRLPADISEVPFTGYLTLENGERQRLEWSGADLQSVRDIMVEGTSYVEKKLPLRRRLPPGYHHLTLEAPGKIAETLVISAPRRAYLPEERIWGAFLPLYALHTGESWGAGDFSDLLTLTDWVAEKGGSAIATLPLLATFLYEKFDPSPYLPVSRLFWNEFYLDIRTVPELGQYPAAQALIASSQAEIAELRSLPLVDYRRQMAFKRRVLEEMLRCFLANPSPRHDEFRRFVEANPTVEQYARFRAAGEKQQTEWQSWPQPMRDGLIKQGDYDEQSRLYHLYVQWLCREQIESLSGTARSKGVRLSFDLPLGVHPDGYDVWKEREIFATGTSAGSPPDNFFTEGQDWGFAPLHPEKIREQGYRYIIGYLRHLFQYAGIIRIDHVMGLHRLFWVPHGMEAADGIYVRYRPEERYAIFCLESQRHRVTLVGEDLGTVPRRVGPAMTRHGLNRMYVANFELTGNPNDSFRPVLPNTVASLNTHDMFPFAGFWQDMDVQKRFELGYLDQAQVQQECQNRKYLRDALVAFLRQRGLMGGSNEGDVAAVIKGCLSYLSASQAWCVLVNLEDLWQETEPQNLPGTTDEHPNWRLKAHYSFEEFSRLPGVLAALNEVNNLRQNRSKPA